MAPSELPEDTGSGEQASSHPSNYPQFTDEETAVKVLGGCRPRSSLLGEGNLG